MAKKIEWALHKRECTNGQLSDKKMLNTLSYTQQHGWSHRQKAVERSQTQKTTHCMTPFIRSSGTCKTNHDKIN